MPKHGKKVDSKADTQEIVKLKDLQEAKAEIEYEDEEEAQEAQRKRIPKAAYRIAVILLALVLGLTLWINRESLNPEAIWSWVKLQVKGSQEGDGFPVQITGSNVYESNFTSYGGSAVILSDTALTVLSSTGKEELSLRHSLNQPVLRDSSGKYLLYNQGSTGYTTVSGMETAVSGAVDKEIRAGNISHSGKFALGVRGSDGASELNVYQKNGELQFHYLFARDYITALALNYDGTHGVVCTVRSEKGEMVSKATVFDFDVEEPVAEYETRNNLLLAASWGENGAIYAVGDSALLTARSGDYAFSEYSYEGRQLTAYRLDSNRAFLSVSAYEHAGPSTLLVFREQGEPVRMEEEERIEAISVSGGTVGLLIGSQAVFCDYSTGRELGRADAGSDAKSLALSSESQAYILGVSEIRTVALS